MKTVTSFQITILPTGEVATLKLSEADRKEIYALAASKLGIEVARPNENEMPSINFSKVNLIR